MLTVHTFAARKTTPWLRTLLFLGATTITYLAWGINVLDEHNQASPGHVTIQLNESVYLGLLITTALLLFGAWQYIAQRREIECRIIAEQRARHLAYHDSLTGLQNRRSLEEGLGRTLASAPANERRSAVLMLDFDHFKKINDVYGHATGDEFLRIVSARMLQAVPTNGTVGRLGGDEFAVILNESAKGSDFAATARRIISVIGEPIEIEDKVLTPELSIGIVEISGTETVSEILRMADLALYRAKSKRGSCFLFYSAGMEEDFSRSTTLLQDLRQALRLEQFRVYYQPLIHCKTGQICAYEALLRWVHPLQGIISPTVFIPLAEESGLISSIGEWVLHQACRDAAAWPETIKVSVNVSPRQFLDGGFPSIVEAALATTGLEANRLVLEITETVLLRESAANLDALREIRTKGVAIALDDFGTGFSSLGYLQTFPFDIVKIDRSFVKRIGKSAQSEKILRTMIELLTSLKVPITAEGVETEVQREWVSRFGCHNMQGYLFDRPRPIAEIAMLQ
ncbi:bifunctional diguanylate cyclase/phosphodiesterase [Rhizobium laguerreae]|jgi:diguanylate cyclase (GGDEF)-like protein|uniref:putative bifunctional diguanylate cyclase/phosphodiesterase n=1 Tax=Rhizobium laguerreae TaxID=1076926 RepID=UPI001C9195DD|nr:bifunctional diguanylate cyclase/phosphodiesterase [Rhizobium laguerreae]MBY3307681.1 bifunctional diguanylate cyclase/phosphodiesterase [Rhizobium laguerreae]